jgi:DNA-binding MarR family transcriptional regulator
VRRTTARRAGALAAARAKRPGYPEKQAIADDSAREPLDMSDLNGLLGFLIRRAQLWVFQDFIRSLAHLRMRPAEYAVLSVVEANPGLSQMALANALGIERAQLARLLNRLEDRLLLNRIPSLSDGRSHCLHLTERGHVAVAKSRVHIAAQEKRMARMVGARQYEEMKRALLAFTPDAGRTSD